MWRYGILLAVASCGRLGFADLITTTTPDGASAVSNDAGSAGPQLVACGSAQRFMFDTDQAGIGVAARTNGFDVFDADSKSALWGYSYTLGSDGVLAPVAEQTQLGSGATGDGVGGASIGDQSVVVADTSSSSTLMLEVDATFASAGGGSIDSSGASGTTPLAVHGNVLLLAQTDGNANAIARLVTLEGTETAPTAMLGSASLGPYYLDAMATNAGFAVGFATSSPSAAGLALLDTDANVVDQVALKPGTGTEMYSPWFAYSAGKNAFIVAWHQKDSGRDDAWAMIVDGSTLATIVPAFEVMQSAANVVAAADDDGFWLAYQTGTVLSASHVDLAGNVTARPVASSGGNAEHWNPVQRDGQALLVWTESGGTGPNLYLDPFCN